MRRRKAWGQHFLANRSIIRKILAVIDPRPDELVIEVGAGKGALTFPLCERAGKVIAVEKDAGLVPYLLAKKADNLVVHEKDILRLDFRALLAGEGAFHGKTKIVGNLPYAISTPLLFRILENRDLFSAAVFLLQKEVAERVAGRPGTKAYAPLSILFQLHFDVRLHFDVAPGSFVPPPQVTSTLISLTRREAPLHHLRDERRFGDFLRVCFSGRRKTLLNNLKKLHLPAEAGRKALLRLGLSEKVRAEELSVAEFVHLYDTLRS